MVVSNSAISSQEQCGLNPKTSDHLSTPSFLLRRQKKSGKLDSLLRISNAFPPRARCALSRCLLVSLGLPARCVGTFTQSQEEGRFPFRPEILCSKLNAKFSHDDERPHAAPAFSVISIQDFIMIMIIAIFGQQRSKQTFVSSSRERHRRA